MKKYGFKISGCLGDIVNATPVFKYVSRCHNQKLLLETNLPHLFKNNPYIENIYDTNKGFFLFFGKMVMEYKNKLERCPHLIISQPV